MRYKVITDNNLDVLESRVEHYLGLMWQLQGGVCVYNGCYYQALYRED